MDPRLLKYYNRELQHLREMGGEFATEFPKIAGRLGLDSFECADPYVERLLEGFAFLAARVQLRMDAEFPRFTQSLLEIVYPHYLAPTPSMAVVQFHPSLSEGSLAAGFTLPRGSTLRGQIGKGEATSCEYRTSQDVTLWPLKLAEAAYFSRDVASVEIPNIHDVKAGLRLKLQTTAGLTFNKTKLDRLPFFIRGSGELPMQIYEQLLANCVAVVVRPCQRPAPWQEILPATHLRPRGFEDDEALLPYGPRSFQGYRLLHEYFACPQRFMFAEFSGLASAVQRCDQTELELLVLFDRHQPLLETYIKADNFALFCSPAINLFPKSADRIHLTEHESEHHVIPDRTKPLDFEVYQVSEVEGYGSDLERQQTFLPFYAGKDQIGQGQAYYTISRQPRVLSTEQRKFGPRSSYIGSELYVSLVDAQDAPFRHDLRQLGVSVLCTNRDLPLQMPVGKLETDFHLSASAPVESIRCLAGPTRPRNSPIFGEGDLVWRVVSHFALNYLSLTDSDTQQGAAALRELLRLYGDASEPAIRKQVEGVKAIRSQLVTRRIPTSGPITFGRGLEVAITCDEAAFEGSGVFLLGAVLERFFAKYVSLNSFTETVLQTVDRGQVHRWPARMGRRQLV